MRTYNYTDSGAKGPAALVGIVASPRSLRVAGGEEDERGLDADGSFPVTPSRSLGGFAAQAGTHPKFGNT